MKRTVNNFSGKIKPSSATREKVGRTLVSVIGGTILTREWVLKQLPFIIFLTFLGTIYIANIYAADRTIIAIEKNKKANEVFRYEHVLMKSKLMGASRRSEVIRRLENTGVKESLVPPVKLVARNPKQ